MPRQQLSLLELTAAVYFKAATQQPTADSSQADGSSRAAKRMRVHLLMIPRAPVAAAQRSQAPFPDLCSMSYCPAGQQPLRSFAGACPGAALSVGAGPFHAAVQVGPPVLCRVLQSMCLVDAHSGLSPTIRQHHALAQRPGHRSCVVAAPEQAWQPAGGTAAPGLGAAAV